MDEDQSAVFEVIRRQRMDLTNPPKSPEDMLATFEGNGLKATVGRLRMNIDEL